MYLHQLSEVAIVESVDQVLKQGAGQKQGHYTALPKLQCRRFLTVFGYGRVHHSLDAVAAQTAVVADAFDFQERPVDSVVRAFAGNGRLDRPLFTPKSHSSDINLCPWGVPRDSLKTNTQRKQTLNVLVPQKLTELRVGIHVARMMRRNRAATWALNSSTTILNPNVFLCHR